MSGLILHLAISQSHVFLLNSRLGHFSAPRSRGGPFSRSYRAILPSSLATDHSSTFGFSPRPPVSVSGTGRRRHALEVFPGSLLTTAVRSPVGPRYFHARDRPADLPAGLPYPFQRAIPSARGSVTSPSLLRFAAGCWNVDQLSIGIAFRLILRPRLTLNRLSLFRKPWSSGGRVSHPPYRYLCLHLLFHTLQQASRPAFGAYGMLPYRYRYPRASVPRLYPFIIHATPLDQ
ncbi:MAG: Uncharacterized protein AUK64_2224 [bacterium P201]|nr:MAG: Uncharacterized protein AUK64_2224 [bacterium P201]